MELSERQKRKEKAMKSVHESKNSKSKANSRGSQQLLFSLSSSSITSCLTSPPLFPGAVCKCWVALKVEERANHTLHACLRKITGDEL
mmetsp:Transcript_118296/g.331341  ORF Transcript_118296/g.331341 Transcript_118296/m.331341 type:complete len:88 (+) Transcript_118296:360-623(+)